MKKILLVILVLVLSFIFISCKDDNDKTLKEVTLTKNNWYEYLSISYTTEEVGDYYNYKYTVAPTNDKYTFKDAKMLIFTNKRYSIPSSGNTSFNVKIKKTDIVNNYAEPSSVVGKVLYYE